MSARAAAKPPVRGGSAKGAAAKGGVSKGGAAKAGAASGEGGGSRGGMTLPLIGLTLVALAVLPTSIVLAVGMIPTLVAWIIDRDEEKYAPITVGVMNLCGVLPGLLALWNGGHTIAHALSRVSDPYTLLWAFGAASVGWAIHMGVPPLVGLWHVWRTRTRIDELEDRQRRLVEEWGRTIAEPPDG